MSQKLSVTVELNILYSPYNGIKWTHNWKALSICLVCFISKTARQILGTIISGLGYTSTSEVNIINYNCSVYYKGLKAHVGFLLSDY
jgi:hypothetical protein